MSILILGLIALASFFSFISHNQTPYYHLSKIALSIAFIMALLSFLMPQHLNGIINIIVLDYAYLKLGISLQCDTLACLMLSVVTLISLIIYQYAVRYLESDMTRPRFLGQLSLITLSVSVLVLANNLLTAFIGWQFIGLTLYVTLNHYHYDPLANRSAKKKFIINRVGDLSFLTAVILCYQLYGTSSFDVILSQNNNGLIGFLIFIAIMTKSAQFPFHIWLPDTMEAPTPVSALMHAGVINAGGYLLARLSPLYIEHTSLLIFIFMVGLITALLGSLFTFFQFDTKKKLAYSTMSQMGYMILQCGTGAFLSAIYHLIAHGFFKACLFLNAGNTLTRQYKTHSHMQKRPFLAIVLSLILIVVAYNVMAVLGGHMPLLIWGFIYITLLQMIYKMVGLPFSNRMLFLALAGLLVTLLIFMIIIAGLNHILPTLETSKKLITVFQVSVVFIALSFQIASWFVPSIQSPASSNKLIEQLFIRKLYIEEIYRGSILQIIRRIGDHFNNRHDSDRYNSGAKHPVVILVIITFAGGLLLSSFNTNLTQIVNVSTISFFLLILILAAISANRADRLFKIFYWLGIFEMTFIGLALFINSITLQKVALYHLVNIIPLIGMMLLLLRKPSEYRINEIDVNKLSWHKFYVGVLLILMLGVPGTAMFVTEIYIMNGLIAMNQVLGFVFALGMILLSISILHCLQLYVFDRQAVYYTSPKVGRITHVLCWSVIALNILSGLFPNLIISTLINFI